MFSLLKSGFKRLQKIFSKTRLILGDQLHTLFKGPLDEETFEKLEEILFEADLGALLAAEFAQQVTKSRSTSKSPMEVLKAYAEKILSAPPLIQGKKATCPPQVILIVGVNGSGKTTSCAKLAHLYQKEGKRVILASGDTFRAAATQQLSLWAKKLGIDCVKGSPGGDPASVIFDTLLAAKTRGHDVVIADTAGRLHSKTDLMEELSKIKRVIERSIPEAPHEIYLVLDATTGQNAIDQAKTFHSFTPLSGLILTKVDGSAKGGALLSIYHQMRLPIRYLGTGERLKDFVPFSPKLYVDALFS